MWGGGVVWACTRPCLQQVAVPPPFVCGLAGIFNLRLPLEHARSLRTSKRKKRKRKHREMAPSPAPPDPLSEFQSLSEDRRKRLAHEWAAVDAVPVTVSGPWLSEPL